MAESYMDELKHYSEWSGRVILTDMEGRVYFKHGGAAQKILDGLLDIARKDNNLEELAFVSEIFQRWYDVPIFGSWAKQYVDEVDKRRLELGFVPEWCL